MFSVKIIAVGRLKEKFYLAACDEYLKRLSTMADVRIVELTEEAGRPDGPTAWNTRPKKYLLLYQSRAMSAPCA